MDKLNKRKTNIKDLLEGLLKEKPMNGIGIVGGTFSYYSTKIDSLKLKEIDDLERGIQWAESADLDPTYVMAVYLTYRKAKCVDDPPRGLDSEDDDKREEQDLISDNDDKYFKNIMSPVVPKEAVPPRPPSPPKEGVLPRPGSPQTGLFSRPNTQVKEKQEEKELFTQAEVMTGVGNYKNIPFGLPQGSTLVVTVSYKLFYDDPTSTKRVFTIRYFIESSPYNSDLGTIYILLVKVILNNYLSSIFSSQCKFVNIKFYNTTDKTQVTQFPIVGVYGKTESANIAYPVKFSILRRVSNKPQQLVLYGIPNECLNWDSSKKKDQKLLINLSNFTNAFSQSIKLKDIVIRCVGVSKNNTNSSNTVSKFVTTIYPEKLIIRNKK